MEGRCSGTKRATENYIGIKGFVPVSMTDWDKYLSAVIFFGNCNFKCTYCHNPEIAFSPDLPELDRAYIVTNLISRKNWLEGVVLSGGEPTLNPYLFEFIKEIKDIGFKVKLDTNGSKPHVVSYLLKNNLIDYIALDVKTSLSEYHKLTGNLFDVNNLTKTIDLILKSGIDHEFRTTIYPEYVSKYNINKIIKLISGCKLYVLQQFNPKKTLSKKAGEFQPYKKEEAIFFLNEIEKEGIKVVMKGFS